MVRYYFGRPSFWELNILSHSENKGTEKGII